MKPLSLHCTVQFSCVTLLCSLPPNVCFDLPFFFLNHSLYPCSYSPHTLNVLLSICPFPVLSYCFCLSAPIVLPAFACQLVPFYCIALSSKMSSLPTYILPSDPSPTSSHPSLSLSCVTPPSLPPSRDNYYKPCEDQLAFKQLNKQTLGLLTVAIQQQHSSKKVDYEIKILCIAL